MTGAEYDAAKTGMHRMISGGASAEEAAASTGISLRVCRSYASSIETRRAGLAARRTRRPGPGVEPLRKDLTPEPDARIPVLESMVRDRDAEIERQAVRIDKLEAIAESHREALGELWRRLKVIVPVDLEDRIRDLAGQRDLHRDAAAYRAMQMDRQGMLGDDLEEAGDE